MSKFEADLKRYEEAQLDVWAKRCAKEKTDKALVDQFYRELEETLKPKSRNDAFVKAVEAYRDRIAQQAQSYQELVQRSQYQQVDHIDWHHAAAAELTVTEVIDYDPALKQEKIIVPGDELLRDSPAGEIGN